VEVARALYLKCQVLDATRGAVLDKYNDRWPHPENRRDPSKLYTDNHISSWLSTIYSELHIDGYGDIDESICQLFREVAGDEPDWESWPPDPPVFPALAELGVGVTGQESEESSEEAATAQTVSVAEEAAAVSDEEIPSDPSESLEPESQRHISEFLKSGTALVIGSIIVVMVILLVVVVLNRQNEPGDVSQTPPAVAAATATAESEESELVQPGLTAEFVTPPTPSPASAAMPVATTPSITNTPTATATPSVTPSPTRTPSFTLPFTDTFESGYSDAWTFSQGEPLIDNGRLTSLGDVLVIEFGEGLLTDYVVEFDFGGDTIIHYTVQLDPFVRFHGATNGAIDSNWQQLEDNQWNNIARADLIGTSGSLKFTVMGNYYRIDRDGSFFAEISFGETQGRTLIITLRDASWIDNVQVYVP
jgi:hypothetical protein